MKHTEQSSQHLIDVDLGVPRPQWESGYGVDPAVLLDQVVRALEKATQHRAIATQLDLSDSSVSSRVRYTIPKPFRLERMQTAQTPGEFLRTIMATLYALPEENKTIFLCALQPLMAVLEDGRYLPATSTKGEAHISTDTVQATPPEKDYVNPEDGCIVLIDQNEVLFEKKDLRLYYLFQFLLLQRNGTTLVKIVEFLLAYERKHVAENERRSFFGTAEIYDSLKQLEGLLTTIPGCENILMTIEMSSKKVVLHVRDTDLAVTYFRRVKVFYSKFAFDVKAVKSLRPTVGFAGLEQYIPEYAVVFLDTLRDLANETEVATQAGWVTETSLYATLRSEIPGLMEAVAPVTGDRRRYYTVDVVGTDLRRVLGPLESLIERQASGEKNNPTKQVRYRLNPRLQQVDSPQAAQQLLDLDFGP